MNQLLEIIHITLIAISKSVYNYWFLMVVWTVYFLIRKIYNTNIYNIENAKSPIGSLIESVLQGILVGIIGSLIIILTGLPVNSTVYIIYLLPISLALSLIQVRYLCISYSAAVMGLLALILNGQIIFGYALPNMNMNVSGLITLVGILHLMESLLIYFVGADDCMPIICKKEGKIIQGHILQKYWPIPLAILFVTAGEASGNVIQMPDWWPLLKPSNPLLNSLFFGLMPFVGILGYSTVTFSEQPEKRAKKTGIMLFLYSMLIIAIAVLGKEDRVLMVIGLVLMAALHEAIMLLEQRHEKRHEPIYTVPDRGIRIMSIIQGGIAEKVGMKKGQIIKKINDLEVVNAQHFKELMDNKWTFMWIETENFNRELNTHEIKAYPAGLDNLGIKILPENPRVLFKYESLKKVGVLDLLRYRKRR
ncbi:MAG: hypothetical protein CVU84_07270 [Firmicutes bacterium HGW-Firmicutes-1]|nr:MAG: hypothetical protein CVU84_07270 [Firmicutes bacterium HGW-Firmicutes-1]